MSEAKVSEAAVHAALVEWIANRGTAQEDMRAAIAAALPHLHPQPASRQISDCDRRVLEKLMEALPTIGLNGWAVGAEVLGRVLDDSLDAPQPAELAEQQGVREQFEVWAHRESLSLHKSARDGEYNDARTISAWSAWQTALAATGKLQVGDPGGWSFKIIDGNWAVSNPCCGISSFLHAPYLHTRGCEQSMKPFTAAPQHVGKVQGDALETSRLVRQLTAIKALATEGDAYILHEAITALAVRQPVAQEPVAFVSSAMLGSLLKVRSHNWMPEVWALPNGADSVPLYAASPAQGINLGQFNALAALANAIVHHGDESPMKNGVFGEAERLLALIDQRDAAPGVE